MELAIFIILTLSATALLLLTVFVGEVFEIAHDFDFHVGDFHVGGGDSEGGTSLSLQSVAAFLAGFGAAGWLLMGYFNMPSTWAALLAVVLGGVPMFAGATALARLFMSQQATASFTPYDLIGTHAMVVLPIPESGLGRVQVVHQGVTRTLVARSQKPINQGQQVTITGVIAGECVVQEG